MENDYIALSTLNDFIFCPYSIYLHNIYYESDESTYHATPQTRGRLAHEPVDAKRSSTKKDDILSLPVFSNELGIMGRIDCYRQKEKHLIERKYQLKQIYQGQIYQLWGECFCLQEMGYKVEKISFYEITTNRTIPMEMPGEKERAELRQFIEQFRAYQLVEPTIPNPAKCQHCIYNPLCDKAPVDNVYQ